MTASSGSVSGTGPVELIRTPDEISAAWLSSLLPGQPAVASAEVQDLGEAAGLMGELFRVTPTYSGDATGPTSLIVKLPSVDPQQRGVADALGFYKREVTFYNNHTAGLPFGVAESYVAIQAEDSTDFVLAMEDLGSMQQIDQVAGATLDQARTAIAQIARFHAAMWNHADLPALGETFLPMTAPLYHAALPGIFESGWPNCKEKEAANLTPDVEAFGDCYGERLPGMLAMISEPQTMVHGDFRGDNLMFDADGNLIVIDFQISGVANGLYDIAYFTCQSIATDVRRGNDEDLVRLYVDTLAAEGVDYAFEDAMKVYRVATAFCLIYAVTSFQAWDAFDGRQHELMSAMLSRTVQSIIDNDSLAALNG